MLKGAECIQFLLISVGLVMWAGITYVKKALQEQAHIAVKELAVEEQLYTKVSPCALKNDPQRVKSLCIRAN